MWHQDIQGSRLSPELWGWDLAERRYRGVNLEGRWPLKEKVWNEQWTSCPKLGSIRVRGERDANQEEIMSVPEMVVYKDQKNGASGRWGEQNPHLRRWYHFVLWAHFNDTEIILSSLILVHLAELLQVETISCASLIYKANECVVQKLFLTDLDWNSKTM